MAQSDDWQEYTAYHGTHEPDLTWGDLEPRMPPYRGSLGEGIYLGQERDTAAYYGPNVLEGKVRFRNPLVLDPENYDTTMLRTPTVHDDNWMEYRVKGKDGDILYEGNDEAEAQAVEEANADSWLIRRSETDEYIPESVLIGERVTPFDVYLGGEWVPIRDHYDLAGLAELAKMHGHDGLVTRNIRGAEPPEEMLAFDRSSLLLP